MFRKLICILFLPAVFLPALFAQSPEAMLQRGNEYYQAKNYNKAIESYENLVEQDYQGPELFYNLGNSYYRVGKIGYAILYYEKALQLAPSDEDIQHNLALANLQTADKIETLPRFFLFEWWESLLAMFSISGWAMLAYIIFIVLLACIVFYFFARDAGWQKYSVYGSMAASVLLALVIVMIVINLNRENNIKRGIITTHTVTVKLSPDVKSNDAFVIHEGSKVNIEDRVDNWLKIRLMDGKIGWLQRDNLRVI